MHLVPTPLPGTGHLHCSVFHTGSDYFTLLHEIKAKTKGKELSY